MHIMREPQDERGTDTRRRANVNKARMFVLVNVLAGCRQRVRALRFMRMHEMSVAMSGQFKRVPELIWHIPNRRVLLYEKCPTIQNVQELRHLKKVL